MILTCGECGSNDVICSSDYYTNGASMEKYTWAHTCRNCGEVSFQEVNQCYGMDTGEETCALGCGRKYSETSARARIRSIVEILSLAHIQHSADKKTLWKGGFQDFKYKKGEWRDILSLQNELYMLCRIEGEEWTGTC